MQLAALRQQYQHLNHKPLFLVAKVLVSVVLVWWVGPIALDTARLALYAIILFCIYQVAVSLAMLTHLGYKRLFG